MKQHVPEADGLQVSVSDSLAEGLQNPVTFVLLSMLSISNLKMYQLWLSFKISID